MLPKRHRLTRSEEIRTVLRSGFCVSVPGVRMCALKAVARPGRMSVIVGKKVDRRATVRHRYQRRLRELGREAVLATEKLAHYDMVWVALPPITKYRELPELRVVVVGGLERLIKRL